MHSSPAWRSEAIRSMPPVLTSENPSLMPAAAESTTAVSSKGPWAVTKVKKLSLCGVVAM